MFYTLIEYTSSGVDTCRGCIMDRWNSDFDISYFDDREKLIKYYAKKKAEESTRERNTGLIEFTVLINGRNEFNCIWNDDLMAYELEDDFLKIENEVNELSRQMIFLQKLKGEN